MVSFYYPSVFLDFFSKRDNINEILHKAIEIYSRGLLLVTGHTPKGNLLSIRYMLASA